MIGLETLQLTVLGYVCFQIVRERYGALEYVDLIPDGGNTPVNAENRYVIDDNDTAPVIGFEVKGLFIVHRKK